MAGPLKKPEQFKRPRGRLPGQSDPLDLESQISIRTKPVYTVIERDLVQIGNIGAGRYVEIDPNGVKLYSNGTLLIELDVDGNITVGSGDERVEITADGLILYSNNAANLDLGSDGTITVGSGDERIEISESGIISYVNNSQAMQLVSGNIIIGHPTAAERIEIDSLGISFFSNFEEKIFLNSSTGAITVGSGFERVEITSNGIDLYTNNTKQIEIVTTGAITIGSGDERVEISAAGLALYANNTLQLDLQSDGDIVVGLGDQRLEINSAGVKLYSNNTLQLDLQSDGDIVVGLGDQRLEITSAGVKQYANDTLQLDLQSDGDIIVGPAAGDHVEVASSGITMQDGSTIRSHWQTDGDMFLGSDIAAAATTYISIFAGAQTYNGESMAAGDMLIGDNSANKANILWDKSAGQLLFRGGQTTKAYVDTDGAITAGAGDVILDDSGLALAAGTGTPNQIKINDDSDNIFRLYSQVDSQTSQLQMISEGKDSSNHEAYLQLQVITDDGAAHAGAAQCYFTLDTAGDVAVISATQLRGFKICRLSGMTTTQRNALTPVDGMMIYNSTTGKFQGRASGAWVDFH